MNEITTITDGDGQCFTLSTSLKKRLESELIPKAAVIGELYDELDSLIRINLVERLRRNQVSKISELIYICWAEIDKLSPIREGRDIISLLLNERLHPNMFINNKKNTEQMYYLLTNTWNLYSSPMEVGGANSDEFHELTALITKAEKLIKEYESKFVEMMTLLSAIRIENDQVKEVKEANRLKSIAEKDLAENMLKSLEQRDSAIESLLVEMDVIKKELIELKNNPQKEVAGTKDRISQLIEALGKMNVSLISCGNIDVAPTAHKTDVNIFKIGDM